MAPPQFEPAVPLPEWTEMAHPPVEAAAEAAVRAAALREKGTLPSAGAIDIAEDAS